MRLRRLLASVIALVSLAACTSTTFSLNGPLAIETGSGEVRLHNRTQAPVYAFVIERRIAAVTDWGACSDPATCEAIAPGERLRIAYEDISGYGSDAEEIIVYWWHLVPATTGGGFHPDSVRAEVVRIQ